MSLSVQILRRLAQDIQSLLNEPLEGIRVYPNEDDITEILADIDGPVDTPFEGGVFRMKLAIGPEFPASPPKGYFLTKIFHPNVSERGEICVNTLKRDWNETLGFKHILLTIKCLLIVPNPESSLNEDAGRLLLEHYDDYFQRAKLWTQIHAMNRDSDPAANVVDTSLDAKENLSENVTPTSSSKVSQQQRKVRARKAKKKKAKRRL
eukprot:TRINITY_DN11376_c0_g1_i1.p1 TRINITY_DN11376_c0_g1~~TRINITY_DN11376_c0_g1_i1.p1  ORF type:complete len:207 (-),score=52.22 TRINITY_DN11376_c0_g1_i1:39-659(-)